MIFIVIIFLINKITFFLSVEPVLVPPKNKWLLVSLWSLKNDGRPNAEGRISANRST